MVLSSNVVSGDNREESARIQRKISGTGAEYKNVLSGLAIYPISDMQRLHVPNSMVPWEVNFITKFKFLVM